MESNSTKTSQDAYADDKFMVVTMKKSKQGKYIISLKRSPNTSRLPIIDLSDVPEQDPILKEDGYDRNSRRDNTRTRPISNTASKYMGVYEDKCQPSKRWKAQIMIDRRVRSLGYFETELEAAKVYAKASYKYKRPKDANLIFDQGIDLRNIPEQESLILNDRTRKRDSSCISNSNTTTNMYKGVKKLIKPNKPVRYQTKIAYNGQVIYLGTYDNPEEAAQIYAKAQFFKNQKQKSDNFCTETTSNDSTSPDLQIERCSVHQEELT